MAVGVVDESRCDLWVFDVESAARLRLTNEADVRAPIWTPDGERIIFSWDKEPPGALFWIPADGSGEAERLTTLDAGTLADVATSVTPDGQALLVVVHANEVAALPQINVVLNWFEELKDLVPVP